jgi:hypothetical protein
MKLKLIMLVSVFALGLAFSANAGSVVDTDSDLVPDPFDNCTALANGPGQTSNQVDSDLDGYGNACDADYTGDFLITTLDFSDFLDAFTGVTAADGATDHNGDGLTTTLDFSTFLAQFQGVAALGPGLSCAGVTVPCLP